MTTQQDVTQDAVVLSHAIGAPAFRAYACDAMEPHNCGYRVSFARDDFPQLTGTIQVVRVADGSFDELGPKAFFELLLIIPDVYSGMITISRENAEKPALIKLFAEQLIACAQQIVCLGLMSQEADCEYQKVSDYLDRVIGG